MNIVALAGGVGGAKLADGLAQILPPENLTVIVNTGDDFEHLGLKICPDLDTVCYTLAGLANPVTGWGLAGESWNALEGIAMLGGPRWFGVGDRDLGTHLERTRRLRAGQVLSQITRDFCKAWGVQPNVLPMSNEDVPTIVQTDEGDLAFQEYFVRRQCHPRVKGFRFEGVQAARAAPGVLEALERADAIVICPSNPWVSVDPILAIRGIKERIGTRQKVVAVSPIIAGQTVKGPAAKMYAELGVEPSALAVARHYGGLLEGFIFDKQDEQSLDEVRALGIRPLVTDTLMKTPADRKRLAGEVLDFIAYAR
ncbi:MAG: 2-phospho-L-lactate transferase [Anaerolineales bacterium]|nr:2-phospho-L-lactate transferase [Anaerolineales bacterium]